MTRKVEAFNACKVNSSPPASAKYMGFRNLPVPEGR